MSRVLKSLPIIITCLLVAGYFVSEHDHLVDARGKQEIKTGTETSSSQDDNQTKGVTAQPKAIDGKAAPQFNLKAIDGKQMSLKSLKGTPLLMVAWATWCDECESELVQLKTIQDQKLPFKILLINMTAEETSKTNVVQFAKAMNLNLPILLDENGSFEKTYRVQVIPTSFLVDEYGNLLHTFYGPVNLNDVKAWLPTDG